VPRNNRVRGRCSLLSCERPHEGRGYCKTHLERWRKHGDPQEHVPISRSNPGRMNRGIERPHTRKANIRPTQSTLGWAAGFLEGEGSFTKNRRSPTVNAVQVNREPLVLLLNLFGGSLLGPYKNKGNRQGYHEWRVCGDRALGVMLTMYPILSERRRAQVRLSLAMMRERRQ
jgi:hypothetical protein